MVRILLHSFVISAISLMLISCHDNEEYYDERIEAKFTLTEGSIETKSYVVDNAEIIGMATENDGIIVENVQIDKWEDKQQNELRTSWGTSGGTTSWTANDRIGIFMRGSSGGTNYYDLNNVQYNVQTAAQSSAATPVSSTIYFPNPNTTNVTFYAYYPYNASNSSPTISYTIPANQTEVSALASADLMSATSASVNGNSPNVPLSFQHNLVLLTFQIKGGTLGGLLTNITLGGTAITNTGTLNLLTNTLTTNTSSTFTPSVNLSITLLPGQTTVVDMIINPCTVASNTGLGTALYVTFSYAGLSLKRTNLTTAQTFIAGTRYTYNINFLL